MEAEFEFNSKNNIVNAQSTARGTSKRKLELGQEQLVRLGKSQKTTEQQDVTNSFVSAEKEIETKTDEQNVASIKSEKQVETVETQLPKKIPSDLEALEEEEEILDLIRLGEEGWKERYYKIKFGTHMEDTDFFKR